MDGGCSRAVYRPLKTWLRRRDAEIGTWLGLHRVTSAAVRASGSLDTYSSSGPPCTSDRGTCSMTFVSDGPAATVTVAVSRSPLGVHAPVTAVIAWMSPSAAVHRRASHKSARAVSVARMAVSAALVRHPSTCPALVGDGQRRRTRQFPSETWGRAPDGWRHLDWCRGRERGSPGTAMSGLTW